MSTIQVVFSIIIICYCLVLWTPILILNSVRLWKHRKEKSFVIRHPKHLYAFFFIAWIEIFVDQPLTMLIILLDIDLTKQGNLTFLSFKSFILLGVFLVFLSRCWLLYYDYRFSDASANLQWRLQLQPTYKTDNMWINRRSTFGNPQYCAKRATIVVFLLFIIYTSTLAFVDKVAIQEGINLLAFITCFIPTILAWLTVLFKIREINDVFQIRKELNLSFIVLFFGFVIWGIITIYSVIVTGYVLDNDSIQCANAVLSVTCVGIIASISAHYIVSNNRKDSIDNTILDDISPLELGDILSTRVGYKIFMRHLVGEFSVESLLFVSEVQQFRTTLNYTVSNELEFEHNRHYTGMFYDNTNNNANDARHSSKHSLSNQTLHTITHTHTHTRGGTFGGGGGGGGGSGTPGGSQGMLALANILPVPQIDLSWLPLAPGLRVENQYFRATYIYSKYITKDAMFEVNISGQTFKELTNFFKQTNASVAIGQQVSHPNHPNHLNHLNHPSHKSKTMTTTLKDISNNNNNNGEEEYFSGKRRPKQSLGRINQSLRTQPSGVDDRLSQKHSGVS